MPKRPKYDPADDEPKVGDIWRREETPRVWNYYLLTEQVREDDTCTFVMLNMNTGERGQLYMNFDLDDWRFHA